MFGTICWKFGSRRETQHDIFNAMGAMYAAVLFIGITNATSVQPVISIGRFVSYRERAAGMYSALPFAFSLVMVEFPYILSNNSIMPIMLPDNWLLVKQFLEDRWLLPSCRRLRKAPMRLDLNACISQGRLLTDTSDHCRQSDHSLKIQIFEKLVQKGQRGACGTKSTWPF